MPHITPYSYRTDPDVPAFDDATPIVIFDGLCVLCSGGVDWMLKHDPNGTSRFAAIQQSVPRALYRHYGLDAAAFHPIMAIADFTGMGFDSMKFISMSSSNW